MARRTKRTQTLEVVGLVHPNPRAVTATLFDGSRAFFLAEDKVQVKYEMLRAHIVDGRSVAAAAAAHGYSRATYYLVAATFTERGMIGLLDEQRGRRGPVKLTPEIMAYITGADRSQSAPELAAAIKTHFGVALHRRTIERARGR